MVGGRGDSKLVDSQEYVNLSYIYRWLCKEMCQYLHSTDNQCHSSKNNINIR